jgi:hypothetical protein
MSPRTKTAHVSDPRAQRYAQEFAREGVKLVHSADRDRPSVRREASHGAVNSHGER